MSQPPYQPAPQPGGAPLTPAEARQWSMLAHLGGIILGFVAPLIVMLVYGPRDGFTRGQAVEALNFQITVAIGLIASIVLSFLGIGLLLYPIVWIGGIILSVLAGVAANRGEPYRYPVSLRLVS